MKIEPTQKMTLKMIALQPKADEKKEARNKKLRNQEQDV